MALDLPWPAVDPCGSVGRWVAVRPTLRVGTQANVQQVCIWHQLIITAVILSSTSSAQTRASKSLPRIGTPFSHAAHQPWLQDGQGDDEEERCSVDMRGDYALHGWLRYALAAFGFFYIEAAASLTDRQ